MKAWKKVVVAVAAGAMVLGVSGCGSDKFAGDWIGKRDYSFNGQQIPNGILYQVHIEKNGDNYLVTDNKYSYEKKENYTDRDSDVTYTLVKRYLKYYPKGTVNSWTGEKRESIDHATYVDYKFTLKDDQWLKSANAVVTNNGGSLQVGSGLDVPAVFHYIEKDKSLQANYSSAFVKVQITLTRAEKNDVTKFLEDTKKAIKEVLEAADKKTRQALSNPDEEFTSGQYVLGNIEFDDSILDKSGKK